MVKFRVNLRKPFLSKRVTVYRLAKDTGIHRTTVQKFVGAEGVIVDQLTTPVIEIARYCGVDWRDCVEDIDEEAQPVAVA